MSSSEDLIIRFRRRLKFRPHEGSSLRCVGSIPQLGSWDPANAPSMTIITLNQVTDRFMEPQVNHVPQTQTNESNDTTKPTVDDQINETSILGSGWFYQLDIQIPHDMFQGENTPKCIEYKYLIFQENDQKEPQVHWILPPDNFVIQLDYPIYHSVNKSPSSSLPCHLVDDTTVQLNLKIYKDVPLGSSVCVFGSIPQLASWSTSRAPKLLRPDSNKAWKAELHIPAKYSKFELKFFIQSDHGQVSEYESCPNRVIQWENLPLEIDDDSSLDSTASQSHAQSIGPAPMGGSRELYATWNACTVRMMICHPLPQGVTLCIIGGHTRFGDWKDPIPLGLGPPRKTLTNQVSSCWELTFPLHYPSEASLKDELPKLKNIQYRYLQLDNAGKALWEREPNRVISLPASWSEALSGIFLNIDGNFVLGMEFQRIPPDMFLGPYPQSSSDVALMKSQGVQAVINLQTDHDMQQRRVDWELIKKCYQDSGIQWANIQIFDFNPEDLAKHMKTAVLQLKSFLDQGLHVYIHCTAGMGRAPAIVVTYLARFRDFTPEDALKYVKKFRPIVGPNMGAVHKALNMGI